MRGVARIRRILAWGLLTVALAAAAVGAAACGPGGDSLQRPVYPDATQRRVSTLSDPTWRVAPLLEEQIIRSTTIVRATLQSATAAVVAEPDGGGYRPVQELRFTTHEYLKGSGPATLLVAVRGDATHATDAAARAAAAAAVAGRVTTWDARQGVLFLRAAHPTYAPVGAGATATEAAGALAFMLSNPDQSPWAYSVDTLSRAWLPAHDPPAEGATPAAFITDGTQSPPPTIPLADLRSQIATLGADLTAAEGIAGYADCIESRILFARHRRAVPWTPSQEAATLASGSAAGTEVYRETIVYSEPRYDRFWLSGPDAARIRSLIIDADSQPATGYEHRLATTRPLPAGTYRLHHNWQHSSQIPCNFVPDDTYRVWIVTVTAPAGTMHEAFFDPAALGDGVVGRDAAHGVLTPPAVGAATGGAAGAAASSGAATLRRLTWDAGQLRLDVTGATLAGQQLELLRLDGTVGLQLRGDAATATATAGGGHELRWPVCTQPWQPGERLLLRISPAPAGDPPAVPACPSAPALPTVTIDAAAPAAGATATLTAAVPTGAGAATYQWQRDVGGVWTPVGAAGPQYQARALTAMTGTWRVRARYAAGSAAHSAPVTLSWPAAATPPCSNGVTVPSPTANPGLVQDCTALLQARDALAGPGRLNWDGTRALSSWTGVTVGGTPQRVVGLRLDAQGLSGPMPAALGELTQLTALDLRGNALTRLTDLQLVGTRLTGCLPAPLAGVTTTDAAAQGLAACQAGPAFGAARYDWVVPAGLPAGGAGLTVTATDAQGGATRVPVVVAVADAAQQRAPPVFPAAGWSFRVAEDAPVGTVVGTAAALDLDGGPLTYALTAGNAAGAFGLDASSGTLTVAGALDYETTPTYPLTLTATDAHAGHGHDRGDRHGDGRARRADVRGGQLRLQRGRRRGGRRSGRDGSGHRRQRAVGDARADGGQPGLGVGTGRDERRAEAGGGAGLRDHRQLPPHRRSPQRTGRRGRGPGHHYRHQRGRAAGVWGRELCVPRGGGRGGHHAGRDRDGPRPRRRHGGVRPHGGE